MSIQLTLFESETNAFNLSETTLNGNAPYPLDEADSESVDRFLSSVRSQAG